MDTQSIETHCPTCESPIQQDKNKGFRDTDRDSKTMEDDDDGWTWQEVTVLALLLLFITHSMGLMLDSILQSVQSIHW